MSSSTGLAALPKVHTILPQRLGRVADGWLLLGARIKSVLQISGLIDTCGLKKAHSKWHRQAEWLARWDDDEAGSWGKLWDIWHDIAEVDSGR